jgi:hypothetical protein
MSDIENNSLSSLEKSTRKNSFNGQISSFSHNNTNVNLQHQSNNNLFTNFMLNKIVTKVFKIIIPNSFIVEIRVSKTNPLNHQIYLYGLDETFVNYSFFNHKLKAAFFKPKEKIDSRYKIFRKLEKLIDQMYLFYSLKTNNSSMSFCLFVENLFKYSNLFVRECAFCKKITKYCSEENSFYPPFYKFWESDELYHNSCFKLFYDGLTPKEN